MTASPRSWTNGSLVWNSFQGGDKSEYNYGIGVDGLGNVYVIGDSLAKTWGSPIRAYSGAIDAHVAKLNGNGARQWNTFLGSAADDHGAKLAVDADGNAYATGSSSATWGSPVGTYAGGGDGFVAKINGTGALQWNTFMGGTGFDNATHILLETGGKIYAEGTSMGMWGSPARAFAGVMDVYVAELSGIGGLTWNTFVGGAGIDDGQGLGLDSEGNVYALGDSYLTRGQPIRAFTGDYDAFVAKITDAANIPAIHLSRTALNYGAVAGGVSTSSQQILIANAGAGTLAWTATPSTAWITATPASGAGTGKVAIAVDPAGLGIGRLQRVQVAFADPGASNSPQTVAVRLTVYAAGTTVQPFGDFATPFDGTTGITGAIPVTGWVLDDVETVKIEIWRDPVLSAGEVNSLYFVGDGLFVEGLRPDVEAGYPGLPFNYRGGWGYMLLTNFLPNHGNGTYVLHAIATDKEGHVATLGTKTIACDNANAVKPFGTIDTPGRGGPWAGRSITSAG